jgi:hypothetical protein
MRAAIGVMAFRQATDLRRSLESVRAYQPNTDTVVFIDPSRKDLDDAQIAVCEEMGVPWELHKEWTFHPGVFNAICDYFLERGYDFCINHHMDSLMLGPVVDFAVETWGKWRDEHGIYAAAVQPYVLCTGHNGVTLNEWFETDLELLRYKGWFYNYPQRERSDPIALAETEFLIWLPAWKEIRPVPTHYYYDRAFSAMCWLAGKPIVVMPMQGVHVLHTGLRTWPGSFYPDPNLKFQRARKFEEMFPNFDGNDCANKMGIMGKSVMFPMEPWDLTMHDSIKNPKYPVIS